jgi:hypothetical protein
MATQAFKRTFHRPPNYFDICDAAWITSWVCDYVARRVREDRDYAHYYALRTTWRAKRMARLRLKRAQREQQAKRAIAQASA